MRLVAQFEKREKARKFYTYITHEGIHALFERAEKGFSVWVYEESDVEKAEELLEQFEHNSEDPKFDIADDVDLHEPKEEGEISEDPIFLARMQELKKKLTVKPLYANIRASLTKLTILLCIVLFLVSLYQRISIGESEPKKSKSTVIVTPIEKALLYDRISPVDLEVANPENTEAMEETIVREAEKENVWIGLYYIALNWPASKKALSAPKFVEIAKGQVWRLVTPVLLHGGFLHILFNMMWVWLLSKQIEERIGKWRLLLMMIIIAILSNTVQYLMVGPAFLGFSGIICGMAGFIWLRQRIAPWEGYPFQRGAALFLAIFVLGIAALQVVSFFLKLFDIASFPLRIANSAHIAGALVGMGLAKLNIFARHHER